MIVPQLHDPAQYHPSVYPDNCTKCSLCRERKRVVHPTIPRTARVLFLGEAPGAEEENLGRPFVGPSGVLLDEALRYAGIKRSEIAIANVVSCRPEGNRVPMPSEQKACTDFLDQTIALLKPELIVPLGATALKRILSQAGSITKARGNFISCREYSCTVLATFHPAYILRNPNEKAKLLADVKKVAAFLRGEAGVKHNDKKYRVINTKPQLDWLAGQLHKQPYWAVDTETTSTDPKTAQIFVVTFSWKEHEAYLIDLRSPLFDEVDAVAWLQDVMGNTSKKIYHNGSYDMQCFRTLGVTAATYYCDTIFMHYLLDETDRHGLEVLAAQYTGDGGYDLPLANYIEENKIENYADIPTEILYPYSMQDADTTWTAYTKMLPEITAQNLDIVLFDILIPTQRILAQTEYDGVSIDVAHLEETLTKYEKLIADLYNQLLQEPEIIKYEAAKTDILQGELLVKFYSSKLLLKKFHRDFEAYLSSIREKARLKQTSPVDPAEEPEEEIVAADTVVDEEDITGPVPLPVWIQDPTMFYINLNSTTQLRELLLDQMHLKVIKYTTDPRTRRPGKNPSMDNEVLETYAKTNAFCAQLAEYRKAAHLKSTFLDGIKSRLVNGKVHSHYLLFSTATGRPSSKDPNLNNIPRTTTATDVKDIFCADPVGEDGIKNWLCEVDSGQAEFRVWIEYAQDEQAIADLKQGLDIHYMVGSVFLGRSLPRGKVTQEQYEALIDGVTKIIRNNAKNIVFGAMYGRGAASIAEQVGCTKDEAQQILDAFFGRYPKAKQRLDQFVNEARQYGYVTSYFGRRRRLPNILSSDVGLKGDAERRAKNCLRKGTLVYTTRGAIPIEEVRAGDSVYNIAGIAKVLNTAKSKAKQVIVTTFSNGCVLETSPEHEFFVPSKDGTQLESYAIKELEEGQSVATGTHRTDYTSRYQKLRFVYPYKLTPLGKHYHINEYDIPVVLDESLAELCGILIGDGCMTFNTNSFAIAIGKKYPEFVTHCVSLFEELFKYTPKVEMVVSRQKGKVFENYAVYIMSQKIKKFFASLGVSGTFKTKRIPLLIFKSPRSVKWAFIKGLMDTDGCYAAKGDISFCSYSFDLAQDFIQLLASLGVRATQNDYNVRGRDHVYNWVTINDKRMFLEAMSSAILFKQSRITERLRKLRESIRDNSTQDVPPTILTCYQTYASKLQKIGTQGTCVRKGQVSLEKLRKHVRAWKLPYFPTLVPNYLKVRSIEYTDIYEEMYDIEIDSVDKLFFANGVAVHNSPIQCTAADFVFLALIRIYQYIEEKGYRTRLVLTVYDSLVFNIPDNELQDMAPVIMEEMRRAPTDSMRVPLIADMKLGRNWGSLVEINPLKDWSTSYDMLYEKFFPTRVEIVDSDTLSALVDTYLVAVHPESCSVVVMTEKEFAQATEPLDVDSTGYVFRAGAVAHAQYLAKQHNYTCTEEV